MAQDYSVKLKRTVDLSVEREYASIENKSGNIVTKGSKDPAVP